MKYVGRNMDTIHKNNSKFVIKTGDKHIYQLIKGEVVCQCQGLLLRS